MALSQLPRSARLPPSTSDSWRSLGLCELADASLPPGQNIYSATRSSTPLAKPHRSLPRRLARSPGAARLIRDPQSAPALRPWRRIAGLHASFFMSGVMHELLIWWVHLQGGG